MGLEELGLVDNNAKPDMSSALYAGNCKKADNTGEVEDTSNHFTVLYDDDTAYIPYPRCGKRAKKLAKAQENSTQQASCQPLEVEADQREGSPTSSDKEDEASQDLPIRSDEKVDNKEEGLESKDPKALTTAQKAVVDLGHSEEWTTGASTPSSATEMREKVVDGQKVMPCAADGQLDRSEHKKKAADEQPTCELHYIDTSTSEGRIEHIDLLLKWVRQIKQEQAARPEPQPVPTENCAQKRQESEMPKKGLVHRKDQKAMPQCRYFRQGYCMHGALCSFEHYRAE